MISIPNESVLRDPLDSFTDREHILSHFQQLLRSAQAGQFRLLAIKGNSGTGKTFLIEYLSRHICPPMGWQTGGLTFAQSFPDFRSILYELEEALKICVSCDESLNRYDTQRDKCNHRFDEYRATITVNQHVEAKDSSSISHNQISVQIDTQLRQRELQLRAEWTRALLELAKKCEHHLCLFIDGYERIAETDLELVGWLWEEVLIKLAKNAPQPILVVTCGWEHPLSAAIQPFSTYDELDDFDRQRIKDYLQAQGILPQEASTQEPLINAFYDLSRGHPLVLSLAVTYFQTLPEAERTSQSLQTSSALISEEARVQWLEERLLKRLGEPYRTLLEYGPLLRSFNQATLKVLLSKVGGKNREMELDDRSYERFLRYPFINSKNVQGDSLLSQPTFHDLVRTVRIEALRRLHPEAKQQLHRTMAEYYRRLIEAERQQDPLSHVHQAKTSEKAYTEWLAEIPEQEFRALLEFLYHALQVREMQVQAFNTWEVLESRAVNRWRRKQAGPLLELVQQVVTEGEPLFAKQKNPSGLYLIWYSRFLEQEARWNDARLALQEAVQIFEQVGNPADIAGSLNNIGGIYRQQGELVAALDYYKRALSLFEQVGNPADIAGSLNNIGWIFQHQGELVVALDYYKRALSLREQVGNPADIATCLNNIGGIYGLQGEFMAALDYYKRALSLFEQVGNPAAIAGSLNNIGGICGSQGDLTAALGYYKRALSLFEHVGNPADVATCLNNIGLVYCSQGELTAALDYYKRALSLREQVGNPAEIATCLNNIGGIYDLQGELTAALDYYQRALSLDEQVGNPAEIATCLNNIGGIYRQQGELVAALDYYKRAISLFEQVGNPVDVAICLNNIGSVYCSQGELTVALDYYKRALSLREQVGNPAEIALLCQNLARLYIQREQWQDAIVHFSKALSIYEQMGYGFEASMADVLVGLAGCYMGLGEIGRGMPYYLRAEQLREQLQKGEL